MYSCLRRFVEAAETIEDGSGANLRDPDPLTDVPYYMTQPAYPSSLMIGCTGARTNEDIIVDHLELETRGGSTRARRPDDQTATS